MDDAGNLTSSAPDFLRILYDDLRAVIGGFRGFSAGWKLKVTGLPVACIKAIRAAEFSADAVAGSLSQIDGEHAPAGIQTTTFLSLAGANAEEPRPVKREVHDVKEEILSLILLGDGSIPEEAPLPHEWVQGVFCGECAAGPWHQYKACSACAC